MHIQQHYVREMIMNELPSIIRNDQEIRVFIRQLINEVSVPRAEIDDRFYSVLQELKNMRKESEKRWEENEKRWEKNNKRWEKNEKRWEKNEKRWEENDKTLKDHTNRLARIEGITLELRYREKISSYFGLLLLKTKVIQVNSIVMQLKEFLSLTELKELFNLDLLVKGQIWNTDKTILVAMEISSVIDRKDVERALYRSKLLRKSGFPAIAAVAGNSSTHGANISAKENKVLILFNGSALYWDEAIYDLQNSGPEKYPLVKK
ncbi:hypothetical protein MHK_001906 [Candidatus Magnetomorum sp. HK-1]|nr:hypothetical protein MHK_001906 [Candidatus Magnetomorum sp. HK-1]